MFPRGRQRVQLSAIPQYTNPYIYQRKPLESSVGCGYQAGVVAQVVKKIY